jgi:hypothetical protein
MCFGGVNDLTTFSNWALGRCYDGIVVSEPIKGLDFIVDTLAELKLGLSA